MTGQNIGSNPIHVSRESSILSRSPRTGVKGCCSNQRNGLGSQMVRSACLVSQKGNS